MKRLVLVSGLTLLLMPATLWGQQQVPILSGAVTIPASSGTSFSVTMNQNITSFTIAGPPAPVSSAIQVIFTQDSTGGRTFSGQASNISGNVAPATTASASTAYQFAYNSLNNTWTVSGGGGSGTIPAASPNQSVIYVSPNCNGQTNCFQVKDDGFMATDCSVTNGSAVVTCTTSHFTSAMADGLHHIAVYNTCSTDAGLSAYVTELGATGATISTFTSGTSITASANATGTVTGTACVMVASLDDTALSNADTAAQASPTCPLIEFPMGIMGTKEPHFTVLPNSCAINGVKTGESAFGPLYTLRGQGINNSVFWWPPDFDFAACTNGADGHACLVNYFDNFKNWGITGGGLPNISGTVDIVGGLNTSTAYFDGFSCINLGVNSSTSNIIGIKTYADQAYLQNTLLDGCGAIGLGVGGVVEMSNSSIQDSGRGEILVFAGKTLNSHGGNKIFGANGMASFTNFILGGHVNLVPGDVIFTNGGTASTRCWQTNEVGDSFSASGVTCDAAQGIVIQNTSATLKLFNTTLTGATGSIITTSGNPAPITDLGGNSIAVAPSLASGTTVLGSLSILGAQVATNITPSTGWGTTGAAGNGVSAASGTSQSERFTITAAGTPAPNPNVGITFPQAFWLAPQCMAIQIGGTGAIQALTTDGTESTTGVTVIWHGTPAAASTYIIQVNCK